MAISYLKRGTVRKSWFEEWGNRGDLESGVGLPSFGMGRSRGPEAGDSRGNWEVGCRVELRGRGAA